MEPPILSVVIVTYNAEALIGDCLASLAAECEGIPFEVFVVDCASKDKTIDLIRERYPWANLIPSDRNLGFSAGNNAALPRCRGQYVALLNPDTVVLPGTLRKLIGVLDEDNSIGAVGPKLVLADGSTQLECVRNLPTPRNMLPWLTLLDKLRHAVLDKGTRRPSNVSPPREKLFDGFNLLWWDRETSCDAPCLSGACMVIRKQVIESVGLLDEDCPLYLDDMDYCRRITDAGWRLRYENDAELTHLWEASTSTLRRQGDFYALQCHAVWLYLRKHGKRADAFLFSVSALFAAVLRTIVCSTASFVSRGDSRAEWHRRLAMTAGLFRWTLRYPKRAPRFGFACEEQA